MPADRASKTVPAQNGVAVTPSNSGSIAECRAVWVGVGGDITVDFRNSGTNITIAGVAAGSLLPIDVSRVYATGTTATDIVVIW
jgi:hypothetical protein